ncbi:MAG: LLM class flavin-dependent oxidoreductase [Acidimicrobiia bacterium]
MSRRPVVQFGLAGLCAQSPTGDVSEFHDELVQIVELTRLAELEGLDSVWLSEHHFSDDCYLPSVLPMLGALAAETERIKLSTNVALAPMYQPLRLAEDCAVLDHLSDGRFMIGLGLGYRHVEFAGLGVDRSQRGAQTEEVLTVLKQAWSGKPVTTGSDATEVIVTPPPLTPGGPAVLVGALAEVGVRRARTLADGWIAPLLSKVSHAEKRVRWLRRGEDDDLSGFHVGLTFTGFIGGDDAWETVSVGALHVESRYRTWLHEADDIRGLRGKQIDYGSATGGPPEHFVCGTPDDVYERLVPWVEFLRALPSGAIPHVTFRLTWPSTRPQDNAESVRLFAREVVPRLKEL